MQESEALVKEFYTAFSKLDAEGMQRCYSASPVFSDPVFGLLQGDEVFYMWAMLCRQAKNFSLQSGNVQHIDEEYCTCEWTAAYSFSATGRMVVNRCKAYMRIQNGAITEHTDKFDFWRWVRQALGLPGLLLGWTGFLQQQVQKKAKKRLADYIKRQ